MFLIRSSSSSLILCRRLKLTQKLSSSNNYSRTEPIPPPTLPPLSSSSSSSSSTTSLKKFTSIQRSNFSTGEKSSLNNDIQNSRLRRDSDKRVRRRFGFIGTIVGLTTIIWTIDRFIYADSLTRTLRLAYNAAIIILDYKLNFDPKKSTEELHQRVSKRLSDTCIKNAGLYIKLGQSIAVQAAILPGPYKLAFEKMFDSSEPITYDQVLRVLEEELEKIGHGDGDLGKLGFEDYFSEFDREPIACGSIAQVHRARLRRTGEIVAVKVQRPDIPIQLEIDLFAYRTLLYVVEKAFELPTYFFANYVSEQIRKETDFICEAKNSERMNEFIKTDKILNENVYIPEVYWDLTTKRVLTTSFVSDSSRLTDKEKLREKGLDKDYKTLMDIGMRLFSLMVFRFGFLHCDLHPGNILVINHPLKPGKPKLALIDHGLYIGLSDEFRKEYCELWKSLFLFDYESIERISKGWGFGNSEMFASATVLQPFRSKKKKKVRGDDGGELKKNLSTDDYESSIRVKETLKILLENEALIPRELIFIGRCMRMMQGNNQTLGSPTNRINILAYGAIDELYSSRSMIKLLIESIYFRKDTDRLKILGELFGLVRFKFNLVLVEIGFLYVKMRQWWIRKLSRGRGRSEGFEDLLQRQIENLAREEFGVNLDETAFSG